MGGNRPRSLAGERYWLLARLAAVPDLTLRALVVELGERRVLEDIRPGHLRVHRRNNLVGLLALNALAHSKYVFDLPVDGRHVLSPDTSAPED